MKKLLIKQYSIPNSFETVKELVIDEVTGNKVEVEKVKRGSDGKPVVKDFGTTSNLAISCLGVAPQKGWDPKTMMDRYVIIEKFEKSKVGDELLLEDKEYDVLNSCVSSMKYTIMHRDIIDFDKCVKSAETFDPNTKNG